MRVVINLPDHEFTEHLIYARAKGFVGQNNNEAVKTLLTFCTKQHIKKYPLSEAQRREVEKNYDLRQENSVASSGEQLGEDIDE
jgi:hypothetical protein